jgi:hypothetical protein
MTTTTKSRILLTVLIVAAMIPGCYLLAEQAYMLYGLILVLGGLAVLVWVWKPWQGFQGKK